MNNNLLKITVCIIILIAPGCALSEPASEARIADLERTVQNLQQRLAALEARLHPADEGERTTSIKPGNSHDKQNWGQLRTGMSEHEVERLLGSPEKIVVYSEYSFNWFYNYPRCVVRFNAQSRKVNGWQEP